MIIFMIYKFNDFEFDCDNLILFNSGKKFSIKEKHAQMLAILLLDTEKIHNKAELLQKVWPEKKVSDQMVFQSIGHLRALFGDDAVKTFSRKGYQWQLPLEQVAKQGDTPTPVASPNKTIVQNIDSEASSETSSPNAPWFKRALGKIQKKFGY
ncbi:transcriptional regulator [Pseudoalteromonas citrea]|uniref:Transcriptional regulator n=2 Tax=Pseudoalteromonas citrea TaxID=43655 RepID=A0A5S3XTX2_9GAMM|nr:transcriptional regulator [Pseudoalteromonas citrea]TMP60735.1 transcriptional regulator [Pseudoalteromonas citrea]